MVDRDQLGFESYQSLKNVIEDEGLISAIGEVDGTEASRGVESFLGYIHTPTTSTRKHQACGR